MAAPAADVKPDVSNGPQDKPQETPQGQGHGHNQFHGPGGGRGGRGGMGGPNRRFGGPGPGGRRDDNRGGNPNRGSDSSGPGNRPKPLNSLPPKVKEEGEEHEGRPSLNRGPPGPRRGGGGGFRGGMGGRDERGPRGLDDRLNDKLAALTGPTHDLPSLDMAEKKFAGRNRLYIGNLGPDVTEGEIQTLFAPYGETSELFVNKEKNFAFIRMDYHANAEKAKRELDGLNRKGRPLKVRFAPNSTAMKVKNLTPWVTNELLEKAFSVFGDIERAVIIVDERGKSTGEGIIEFARKPGAQMALRRCSEGCYFLTASLRPVVLESMELTDDVDGYPEKSIPKKNPDYFKSREMGPRFAAPGSFEYEYGTRWKQLFELRKQKEEALAREMKMEEEKLEAQMEYAKYEHETEMLREQLRQRELDRERQKRDWEMKERQAEEQRRQDEEMMRRQQEEMSMRMLHQEEELRRRQQENTLFMQEQALGGGRNQYDSPTGGDSSLRDYDGATGAGSLPPDPKAFMDAYERGGRYDSSRGDILDEMNNGTARGSMGGSMGGNMGGNMGGAMGANSRSRWAPQERGRVDDYQAKRRRF